jgi:tripartite-type tricarboxylate transporter receptor subunit TctC
MNAIKLSRRQSLQLATVATASLVLPRIAWAQAYPTRQVHLLEGFGAGGASDIVARLISQWLSQRLGQPFVVENRPGASSNIAAEVVAHAAPDGYTLLLITTTNALNATLCDKLAFNFIQDIAPVAGLVRLPLVLLVNPSFPARSLPEFISYAKANPGKINMATPGIGSPMHVASELFKMKAGIDLVPVPYRAVPLAYTDLLGGQVQAMLITLPSALGYISSGQLRALAVASSTRAPLLPAIPCVTEFVPGFEVSAWQGIGAPKNTPSAVIEKLNAEVNTGLGDRNLRARLTDLGGVPMPMTPEGFGKFVAEETDKWAKVIQQAGIKAE